MLGSKMREHILLRSHLPAQHAKRHLHHQMVCYELLRPLGCSKFDKSFKMSNVLKQDERTCTGDKSFNCSACDKTFTPSNGLLCHKRTHSDKETIKLLKMRQVILNVKYFE